MILFSLLKEEMCLSLFPSYSGAPRQLVALCWYQTSAFRHFHVIVTCRPGRVVRSVETLGPRRTCRTLGVGPAEGWTSASAAEKHTHKPHYLIPTERAAQNISHYAGCKALTLWLMPSVILIPITNTSSNLQNKHLLWHNDQCLIPTRTERSELRHEADNRHSQGQTVWKSEHMCSDL